jgi:hypothetical protein
MRATAFVVFWRFIGSFGVGTYLGAAAAGLIALLTGTVFAAGSTWATGLPVLAVLGAIITAVVSRLTRPWLLPKLARHRWLWGAAAGLLLGPLAIAVGELGGLLAPVGLPLMFIGAVTTVVLWVRWYRATHPTPGRRVNPAPGRSLNRTR